MPSPDKLFRAISKGDLPTLQTLMTGTTKEQQEIVTAEGRTLLMEAVRISHEPIVDYLLELNLSTLDAQDKMGMSALLFATYNGHSRIAKKLLEKGANPDLSNQRKETALMRTAHSNHINLLNLLIRYHANIELIGENNDTALIMACQSKSKDAVRALLLAGANPAHRGYHDFNALDVAAFYGHEEMVKILLVRGVDKNALHPFMQIAAAEIAKKKNFPHIASLIENIGSFQGRLNVIDVKAPKEFLCPLAGITMNQPVTVSSGATYDLQALKKEFESLETHLLPCKVVKGAMIHYSELEQLQPTSIIKNSIEDFVLEQEKIYKEHLEKLTASEEPGESKKPEPEEAASKAPLTEEELDKIEEKLRCPIAFDLLCDPVTTPGGITFSRKSLEDLFGSSESVKCPCTRQILNRSILKRGSNLFIEEEIAQFLKIRPKEEDITDEKTSAAMKRPSSNDDPSLLARTPRARTAEAEREEAARRDAATIREVVAAARRGIAERAEAAARREEEAGPCCIM